ncbi:MAG TPA: BolA family transcriptional regulator [Polyangiaceae bacterium]|nr:BolA family transcriptional regulator [Polyangiaceae bacterium]
MARLVLYAVGMPMHPDEVKRRIAAVIPSALIEVTDLTGTQDHYQAKIVSSAFAGKSIIEQHQLVYRALGDAMDGPIHALALETVAPVTLQQPNGDSR